MINRKAPRILTIDARYTMTTSDKFVLLVAMTEAGTWRTFDVASGEFFGDEAKTASDCYFAVLLEVEKIEEQEGHDVERDRILSLKV